MNIRAASLPEHSKLSAFRRKGDFLDCYLAPVASPSISASKAALIAFGNPPAWVTKLMVLRNKLVAPLGLKAGTGHSTALEAPKTLKAGSRLGPFRIYSIDDNEVIMGEDDRHLDFRISVGKGEDGYHIATWVLPHNLLGRSYLKLILPFHKVIVKTFAARLLAQSVPKR